MSENDLMALVGLITDTLQAIIDILGGFVVVGSGDHQVTALGLVIGLVFLYVAVRIIQKLRSS